jgi:hypothetical protein
LEMRARLRVDCCKSDPAAAPRPKGLSLIICQIFAVDSLDFFQKLPFRRRLEIHISG